MAKDSDNGPYSIVHTPRSLALLVLPLKPPLFLAVCHRYGGHIVNDFDRLLANEYLDWYMKDELLDETELYPFAEDEKGVSFLVR